MPTVWSKIEIPLASGLDTKEDPRAGDPTKLDIARDVQFDEIGGVQTRLPFGAVMGAGAIFGGGTLSNCRRMAVVNGEICVFTDTSLYSWNAQLSKWVLRGTHLAVEVDETPMFTTTDDQLDCDRAELSGTVVYAWTVGDALVSNAYAAAIDKTTGSVLMSPTLLAGGSRVRLVALNTKIMLFGYAANNLTVFALDPANPAAAIAGAATTVLATNANQYYDVVKAGTQDVCVGAVRRVVTTSYTAFTVTAGLTVATSTKARTADGPLAVSTIPDGTQTQVIRGNSTNVQGDLLTTATLADVFTGQAIGTASTPINQIAAAHRSVQNSGAYRCYAWWTGNHTSTGKTWSTINNWVDNAGSIGSAATVVLQGAVASRAFDYAGSIFVWLTFGSSTVFASPSGFLVGTTLQNSYFLYRDDATLHAKAIAGSGGGFPPSTGRLPGMTAVSSTSFAFAAAMRRRFDAGSDRNSDFAAKALIDVEFAFDSNAARRMAVIGRTGYIAAGEVLQYDGTRIVECGFHVFPWAVGATETAGGSLTPGAVYAYKGTWRYQNGQGETERSTTATIGSITLTVGDRVDLATPVALTITHKLTVIPAAEYWRTTANPTVDSPFHLITSNDPRALTNPNRYMPNDAAAGFMGTIQDVIADTALVALESNPENGAVLESLAPPAAKIIVSNDTRLFLAGVAGRPDEVWYSRLRGDGEIASFHDSLRVPVPRVGGDITALAFNNETLTVFRETAVYALPGDGFTNLGQGSNFGPARVISFDVGAVSHETVALTPRGVVFKSSKGWYLLGPDWSLQYIGANVTDFDSETVRSVDVVETQHHVRILTSGRMLIWDYLLGHWGEWTISDGLHSLIWNGTQVYLTATGPKQQQTSYSSLTYGLDVETAWIKPAEQQGDVTIKLLAALGEYRSAHLVRWRVARDYQYDGAGNVTYFDDSAWTPDNTTVGTALQSKHAPTMSRCQAFKVRLTAVSEAARASLVTTVLSPQVATDGTVWNSTWTAADSKPGLMGNAVTMTVSFTEFVAPTPALFGYDLPFYFISDTASVVVTDHFTWNPTLERWQEDLNNIGVLVAGVLTVAELEAAIAEATSLAELDVPDASPSKVIDVDSMLEDVAAGSFSGGAYGSPTGEALKLTGLAAEVGVQRGIRRLSAGQAVP